MLSRAIAPRRAALPFFAALLFDASAAEAQTLPSPVEPSRPSERRSLPDVQLPSAGA